VCAAVGKRAMVHTNRIVTKDSPDGDQRSLGTSLTNLFPENANAAITQFYRDWMAYISGPGSPKVPPTRQKKRKPPHPIARQCPGFPCNIKQACQPREPEFI